MHDHMTPAEHLPENPTREQVAAARAAAAARARARSLPEDHATRRDDMEARLLHALATATTLYAELEKHEPGATLGRDRNAVQIAWQSCADSINAQRHERGEPPIS